MQLMMKECHESSEGLDPCARDEPSMLALAEVDLTSSDNREGRNRRRTVCGAAYVLALDQR